MSHSGSPADYAFHHAASPAPLSRSSSPKFNIHDFPATAITATRDTSYASQSAIDDLDFARSEQSTPASRYRNGIKSALFGKKLLSLNTGATATTKLSHPPPQSLPGSAPSSPTKSLTSFITSSNISSASRANTRAKTTSKVIFDNFFTGESAPLDLGITSLRSRSHSRSPSALSISEDGYDCDNENMETSYTRAPVRTRPRRSPTTESTVSKLGSWFTSTNKASPKPHTPSTPSYLAAEGDDPLLTLDIQNSLFPYGPVDPLNPTSFNDLLSAAETVIMSMQNAYRQRVAELATIRSELALKEDEVEECETRAQHLKLQLQDLDEQCTAQTEKAGMLEGMLRKRCDCESSSSNGGSRRGSRAVPVGSDSGFESDGDSVFSEAQHEALEQYKAERPQSTIVHSQPTFSSHLSVENQMLRMRVAELEGAVEGCLDMMSGPWALGR